MNANWNEINFEDERKSKLIVQLTNTINQQKVYADKLFDRAEQRLIEIGKLLNVNGRAAAELARLRKIIDEAPHSRDCNLINGNPCNCWKNEALCLTKNENTDSSKSPSRDMAQDPRPGDVDPPRNPQEETSEE